MTISELNWCQAEADSGSKSVIISFSPKMDDNKHKNFSVNNMDNVLPTHWGWCICSSSLPPAAVWPQWRRTSVWLSSLLLLLPPLTPHLPRATEPTWLLLHSSSSSSDGPLQLRLESRQDGLVSVHVPAWTQDTGLTVKSLRDKKESQRGKGEEED